MVERWRHRDIEEKRLNRKKPAPPGRAFSFRDEPHSFHEDENNY
jgi:hypothetical protein